MGYQPLVDSNAELRHVPERIHWLISGNKGDHRLVKPVAFQTILSLLARTH